MCPKLDLKLYVRKRAALFLILRCVDAAADAAGAAGAAAGDAAAKSPDAGACVCMFVILYPSLIENLMLCTDAALSQTQSFDALSQTQSFDTVDGDDDALTLLHGAAGAGAPPSYLYLGMRPDF